ncbi:hypothetical protein FXO38_22907 [Capsicum annuum]|nr:hypothetical protein FXO38_22907 [Capsicum annuum]
MPLALVGNSMHWVCREPLQLLKKLFLASSVTEISSSRAVPSIISRQFKEILVESEGEILLIFLISRRTIMKVDDVEIYRLDIPKLWWVKMESLGHRTLFVEEESCMWINANNPEYILLSKQVETGGYLTCKQKQYYQLLNAAFFVLNLR